MTLRPALFDLWPRPWPEACKHAWDRERSSMGGNLYEFCYCPICTAHKNVINGVDQSPGAIINLS